MAKNKKTEANVPVTKWVGTAYSFLSTLLLAFLAFGFMVAIPVVAGVALGVFNVGGDKMMLLVILIAMLVCALIGLSWAIVIFMKWSVKNTLINGQKMKLKGCALGLFVNVLKWLFFTIITVGLYIFWIPVALARWKADHVVAVEEKAEVKAEEEANQPRIVFYTEEDDEDDE